MEPPPELVKTSNGLKILVTRFFGKNTTSDSFGEDVAATLATELPEYIRRELGNDALGAVLSTETLRVGYKACYFLSHTEAREIGKAWGADLVFWGQATCNAEERQHCQLSPIVSPGAHIEVKNHGGINASNVRIGVDIKDQRVIIQQAPSGVFKTSMTVVKWRGLETRSTKGVHIDPIAVQDLDFPVIASDRPLALFRFVVGMYAYFDQRYRIAAAYFKDTQAELFTGIDRRSEVYMLIGDSFMQAGDPKEGLAALHQALDACPIGDNRCNAAALRNLGWATDHIGDKKQALVYLEKALSLSRTIGDVSSEAKTLNSIGKVYLSLGEIMQALIYIEMALPLFRQIGDFSGLGYPLTCIGLVHSYLGDKNQALDYFRRALPLFKLMKNLSGEATTLDNIGSEYARLGDIKQALNFYHQALQLREKLGNISDEAGTLNNIGTVYLNHNEDKQALIYFNQALPLLQRTGKISDEAVILNNIGVAHYNLWNINEALSSYDKSLRLSRQVRDIRNEARVLNNLGVIYSIQGDIKQALEYYKTAMSFRSRLGDIEGEVDTLNSIASAFIALDQPILAIESYMAAAVYARKRNPANLDKAAGSLRQAVALALRMGRWSQAATLITTIEELNQPAWVLAALRAQQLWYIADPQAAGAYQRLEGLCQSSATEPTAGKQGVECLFYARAGLARALSRTSWPSCPGLVVTQVFTDSQAARIGLRPGDILLRHQGQCLDVWNLRRTISRTTAEQAVTLEVWRDRTPIELHVLGGRLGLTAATF